MIQENQDDQQDEGLYLDCIKVDMFDLTIPLFIHVEHLVKDFIARGLPVDESWINGPPCNGMAVCVEDEDGAQVLGLFIDPDAPFYVWAHEIVHLCDMAFVMLGIPPGMESTEVRAYLTGHLFKEIEDILAEYHHARLDQDAEFFEDILPGEIPPPTMH